MSLADATAAVEYRAIDGFPGYRVGSDGSVWSNRRTGRDLSPLADWHELQGVVQGNGYVRVSLGVGEKNQRAFKARYVHRLVLLAFVGPCPDGMECRHGNGVRSDNRLGNVSWGTRAQNEDDKRLHGTAPRGSQNPHAKLTEAAVLAIRGRLSAGESAAAIALAFGVSRSTIKAVRSGQNWSHVA